MRADFSTFWHGKNRVIVFDPAGPAIRPHASSGYSRNARSAMASRTASVMVKDSDDAEFDASRTSFTGVRVTARSTRRSLRLMSGTKLIASNRKARHDYTILDVYEAGIMLQGSEVKSLREGHVQLVDAYARLVNGEVWLEGVHIAPYQFAHGVGAHDPARPRKLLLNRDEIERLSARVGQERLALVPLSLYFKDGRAKVELALAQGRTKGDKRQALAKKDAQREIDREMGRQRKGKD